ncbi:MAG TPA: oxygenase MpaB family protein [Candidatus Limnocylindrales bacterium]|nr:oxygenase MpaB family protein [Candidatus Limnocylindrales bacterium]
MVGRRPAARGSLDTARRDSAADRAGLYGPSSEAWRLNREAMLLLGAGPRALLLQLAHPQVAAGVAEHSDFRSDPWRRLQATLRSYLTIVYGTATQARAEIRRLNELHRSIRGRGYRARDPELSLWVHATLVDTTIVAADAWIEPLSRERRARYYAETVPIGRAFGVGEDLLPADLDAFEAYVARMLASGGPVHPGPVARELAHAVLHPPLGPVAPALGWVPPSLYAWTFWPSIGLLPASVRDEYGFGWGPVEQAAAAWLVAGWRFWRPLIPTSFRQMPQALAADLRLATAG